AAGGRKAYPLAGRATEIKESLRKAGQWLQAAQPKSAEERAMQLMGLVWTDAPRPRVAAATKEIRDRQDAAGGWSQFTRTAPDAYATGLSLYALHVAGVPVSDAAYRKGVTFLLGSQYQDGAWLVRTHSFPVQRYFESGFPFGPQRLRMPAVVVKRTEVPPRISGHIRRNRLSGVVTRP